MDGWMVEEKVGKLKLFCLYTMKKKEKKNCISPTKKEVRLSENRCKFVARNEKQKKMPEMRKKHFYFESNDTCHEYITNFCRASHRRCQIFQRRKISSLKNGYDEMMVEYIGQKW